MTDKQIIIDGIDMSGCEFYNKDDKTCREVNGKYDTDICDFDKCEGSNCYYKQLKRAEKTMQEIWDRLGKTSDELLRKEQECDELKKENYELTEEVSVDRALFAEIDQLKAEVKSKTEYIQEQREIINQYSKEIEMYKKCQGKRASKREEELKAENDELKEELEELKEENEYNEANAIEFKQTLTEIKEIAEKQIEWNIANLNSAGRSQTLAKKILQKISECEVK